ncbi:hypothetical protein ACWGJP_10295 [Microbacterium sp. NPDC055903]
MSTSDSHEKGPLTRKQMRELRLTGATPVFADNAEGESAAEPVAPEPVAPAPVAPEPVAPQAAAPLTEDEVDLDAAPLTRKQARAQERIRTASVPIVPADAPSVEADEETPQEPEEASEPEIVSGVPAFAPVPAQQTSAAQDDQDARIESEEDVHPDPEEATDAVEQGETSDDVAEDSPAVVEDRHSEAAVDDAHDIAALGVDADAIEDIDDDTDAETERPTVKADFGSAVLAAQATPPAFTPSFDDLVAVNDSTGSQSIAPNALIFTPSPGEGSLSGPVASTGEVLITGTYELPEGIGSQGHAKGVADGKDVDAVLIDGELPPASSPTPIAASSAISTSKPAGEIIRPPAPEKGNRLMLILAITAGGLALVLAAALVIAFTGNVF